MALGSWQGLYNAVILDLMAQGQERQLLLLMAITTHADEFGFAFPGRARQMALRHCGENTHKHDEAWLVKNHLITVEDIEDVITRQTRPFYQISPRAIYIRPELQEYCEAVFDGLRHRDIAWEKKVDRILRTEGSGRADLSLSSVKDSQPESLTRIRTRRSNQTQNPPTKPDTEPAEDATTQKERTTTTMRNGTAQGEAQQSQRRKAQDRKKTPPGGGSAGDEFEALLSPTVDDDQMVQEIRHIASTTEYQAQEAVDTYTRPSLVVCLRKTARRRKRGNLSNPGGWFFTLLKKEGVHIETPGPNGQANYQDWETGTNTDDMEV
jgi:hypothetical protein